ncbi:hypothetical protein K438DRAFT_1834101 [Mycena galopus ATCC 62051]|nr:hypothetical protein K438DRAFT_1834101 [Mycena galopus ATCC 62051]
MRPGNPAHSAPLSSHLGCTMGKQAAISHPKKRSPAQKAQSKALGKGKKGNEENIPPTSAAQSKTKSPKEPRDSKAQYQNLQRKNRRLVSHRERQQQKQPDLPRLSFDVRKPPSEAHSTKLCRRARKKPSNHKKSPPLFVKRTKHCSRKSREQPESCRDRLPVPKQSVHYAG